MLIRLAHSPDPDDAFMFYGLACGGVDTGPYEFEHVLDDIQALNDAALEGRYEMTAISVHAYPHVCDRYVMTACGFSMGDDYGPIVLAREPMAVERLKGATIAVPGTRTTAFLTLQMLLGRDGFTPRVVMFDRIPDEVAAGNVDAGIVIHEGQLTYPQQGLHVVVDMGRWWRERTGLPLPLGANVIRRDLGPEHCAAIAGILRESIDYGLAHRDEALEFAAQHGRGLDDALLDRFVGMYVNDLTMDRDPRGREAITRLLREAASSGLVPDCGEIEFV